MLKQLGLPHNHSDLSEFADQAQRKHYHILQRAFAEQLLKALAKDFPDFREHYQGFRHLVDSATAEKLDSLWGPSVKFVFNAINDGTLALTSVERFKILRTWVFLIDSFVYHAFCFFGELSNIRRFPGYDQRK